EPLHVGGMGLGALKEVASGRDDGIPPVLGVLLGDAAGGEMRRIPNCGRCHQSAVVVVKRCLVAGGAEVVGDDHSSCLFRWLRFRILLFWSIPVITRPVLTSC